MRVRGGRARFGGISPRNLLVNQRYWQWRRLHQLTNELRGCARPGATAEAQGHFNGAISVGREAKTTAAGDNDFAAAVGNPGLNGSVMDVVPTDAIARGSYNTAIAIGNGDDAIAGGGVPPPFTPGKNNTAITLGNFSSASAIGNHRLAGAFGNHRTKVNTVG